MTNKSEEQLQPRMRPAHRHYQQAAVPAYGARLDAKAAYELFHRAVAEHRGIDWEAIYACYAPLVYSWVTRHSGFAQSGEEASYFVNRAFEKMWYAMTPDKIGNFPDLASLLAYLRLCVHSVIIDHIRREQHHDQIGEVAEEHSEAIWIEQTIWSNIYGQEFWTLIHQRLHNERECQLVYCRFLLDLKPREIYRLFPETFEGVEEVYVMTQNILARLRRDAELRAYVSPS
jgi:DNA-directed RNA polymerase specialized sigma24 family protein